ncbi:MAG: hypothetical protein IPJ88_13480 [Myxococcales bacterium]|nr:MAG: hypothetical protein IPJ88_13480 [Myxococcales bacterium]
MTEPGASFDSPPETPHRSGPPPLKHTPRPPAFSFGVGDEEALKKIRKHTTPAGRIVAVSVVLGAIALGFMYYQQHKALEQAKAAYYKAHEAPTTEAFLSEIRRIFT